MKQALTFAPGSRTTKVIITFVICSWTITMTALVMGTADALVGVASVIGAMGAGIAVIKGGNAAEAWGERKGGGGTGGS